MWIGKKTFTWPFSALQEKSVPVTRLMCRKPSWEPLQDYICSPGSDGYAIVLERYFDSALHYTGFVRTEGSKKASCVFISAAFVNWAPQASQALHKLQRYRIIPYTYTYCFCHLTIIPKISDKIHKYTLFGRLLYLKNNTLKLDRRFIRYYLKDTKNIPIAVEQRPKEL